MAPLCTQAEECTLFWSIHGTGLVTCEPLILKCGFMLESLGCFIIKANNIGIVIGMAYVLGTRTKICQGGSNIQSRLWAAAAAAESLQSCPTLCEPIDGSPPGSPVPGILQAEHWSGLPFPSPTHESKKLKVKSLSRVRLFETPWTAAYQAPLSMGFSRQEYWSGVPLPSPCMCLKLV